MANIIAVIWDCDKTLVDGYMQDPIFKKYNVDAHDFWEEVNSIPKQLEKQGVRVNADTYYLNHFIKCAHNGTFPGLNNAMLREFGKAQQFYPGIPEIFKRTKEMFVDDKTYSEYGIQVEHFIVSTGFAELIRGSELMPYVDGVWGCELLDAPDKDGNDVLSEIVYTIDNTTNCHESNVNPLDSFFNVHGWFTNIKSVKVTKFNNFTKSLVLHFENMIYIADGPSDIPAFSLVNQNGGATFAIYPKGDIQAMRQVEQMRSDGRVDMYAEADYSEGTTAYMWITSKIQDFADRIRNNEKEKILASTSATPRHLT